MLELGSALAQHRVNISSVLGFHLILLNQPGTKFFGILFNFKGGGPRVVVSTAAFHARVRGSVPGLGGLKETKMFLPHPRVKVSIVGSLRDREVACSTSDRQGSNFESCVWRTVSSQSSHHPQKVLLAQFIRFISFSISNLSLTQFPAFRELHLSFQCNANCIIISNCCPPLYK